TLLVQCSPATDAWRIVKGTSTTSKGESHEKILGVVQNGHGGNAEDDGEHKCGGQDEEYGGVGGVDEEEYGEFCRLGCAGREDQTDNERWCYRYQKRYRRLLHRAGRIARSSCRLFCQQPASHHAWGYRRGDGDNANAGNVILRI